MFGSQALQRPERRTVVAKLRVVVILDHETARAGPLDQGEAARRREHNPGRALVRGRCHDHRCADG